MTVHLQRVNQLLTDPIHIAKIYALNRAKNNTLKNLKFNRYLYTSGNSSLYSIDLIEPT